MALTMKVAAAPLDDRLDLDEELTISRYRSLRGKSVSSIRRRAFDVYVDSPEDSNHLAQGDCYPRLDPPSLGGQRLRHRSKSTTSLAFSSRASSPPLGPLRPPHPVPTSSFSSGRGAALLRELTGNITGNITGVIGGFAPRAVTGAVGQGDASHPASPCPAPSAPCSLMPSEPPSTPGFTSASSNLNLAPSVSSRSPSPVFPPLLGPLGPLSPLPSPLPALTPKPTNIPPLSSVPVTKLPQSQSENHSHATDQERSESRGRSYFQELPKENVAKSPASRSLKLKPKSPLLKPHALKPIPSADDIARYKNRNLLALRENTRAAERVDQLDRQEVERDNRDEQEAERWAKEVARLEAETDRILAEQKKRDVARNYAQVTTPSPRFIRFFSLDKLSFFSRGGRSNAPISQAGTPSPRAPTIFSVDFSCPGTSEPTPSLDKMGFIEQGGKGIVPGIDAPTSASNGGDRRVTVRCLSSTISLPVTTDTSPVDILFSTANLIAHDVDPATNVIIECYIELGLERRMRRYERIRDVMNSWDRDQQNSLLVLTHDISENDADLDIKSVSRSPDPPSGFTLQLYHSSRPGKWTKRWITLLETGQMFAAKKPDSKVSDKDSTVLCHLSDFDIYTPRESAVRRHLKAPQRYCYAVKSQQKSIVFPNGENFVHFFCAEDGKLAKRFHEHVHRWRSWYLANKQLDLDKKDQFSLEPSPSGTGISRSTTTSVRRRDADSSETPYTIGAFQPLLDLQQFDNKPLEEFGKDFLDDKPKANPEQEVSKPVQKPKPLTKPHHQVQPPPQAPQDGAEFSPGGLLGNVYEAKRRHADRTPINSPEFPSDGPFKAPQDSAEFSPGGLLGNVYEVKRRHADRTPINSPELPSDGPFTEGPSLLNKLVTSPTLPPENPEVKSWLPSASEHSARHRSHSVRNTRRPTTSDNNAKREKAQPLLSATNHFPEPPRWRENQGRGVKAPTGGGPLINLINSGHSANMPHSTIHMGISPMGNGLIGGQPRISQPSSTSANVRPCTRSATGRQQRPSNAPLVPPLPIRSMRRQMTAPVDQSRGRDPRPKEPLINRAGTVGASSMARH